MNVRELKELLSNFNDDTEVMIHSATGNYWRMVKAEPISDAELGAVEESSYLNGDKVVDPEDFDEFASLPEGQRMVLLIK